MLLCYYKILTQLSTIISAHKYRKGGVGVRGVLFFSFFSVKWLCFNTFYTFHTMQLFAKRLCQFPQPFLSGHPSPWGGGQEITRETFGGVKTAWTRSWEGLRKTPTRCAWICTHWSLCPRWCENETLGAERAQIWQEMGKGGFTIRQVPQDAGYGWHGLGMCSCAHPLFGRY